MICEYCGKYCKNLNSKKQHEIRCKLNPNKMDTSYVSNFWKQYNKDLKSGKITKIYTNQYTKAEKLGLDKPKMSEETKKIISRKSKQIKWSEDKKKRHSNTMKNVVRENPDSYSSSNVNGRVKKVNYKGIILDSSWELLVAKFFDENDIIWERPKIGIEYNWENDIHVYYPDFYLPKFDLYIEVKGYKRERDQYKWNSINNLLIIGKDEIKLIQNNNFDIRTRIGSVS